jgi:3-oxoacyl-[acyl-carrier-protein] synthase II
MSIRIELVAWFPREWAPWTFFNTKWNAAANVDLAQCPPYFIPGVMPNAAAAVISIRYGFMGPSYNIASACATGTHSLATSAMMIEAGEADVMVAGGAESATRLDTVAGFGNARALARSFEGDPTRSSRPFDTRRQGFVMGEGAGVVVLEEEEHALERGAKPLASLQGFGMTTDATHLTRDLIPKPTDCDAPLNERSNVPA